MYKKLFTKRNFNEFLSDNAVSLDSLAQLYSEDEDDFIVSIANIGEKFREIFELPYDGFDIDVTLIGAIDNTLSLEDFFIYDKEEKEIKNNFIKIIDDELDLKLWSKQKIVLDNLNKIINDLENKNEEDAKELIRNLQLTGDNYPVDGGNICSPKKYVANCNEKLPKGFTAIEFRVNTDSRAEFRCFGFLKENIIYLMLVDTKNDGQEKANAAFDKSISLANNYIKKHKLDEELLYSINRGIKMEENVFKELNKLTEQKNLLDYNTGWNDYFNGKKLDEATCSDDYLHGYYAAKDAKRLEMIRQDMCAHHDEIIKKIKEYKIKNKR